MITPLHIVRESMKMSIPHIVVWTCNKRRSSEAYNEAEDKTELLLALEKDKDKTKHCCYLFLV